MTREDAVQDIRAIRRTCKGPKLLSLAEQEPYLAQIRAATPATAPGLVEPIVALRRRLRLPGVSVEELDPEELKLLQLKGQPGPPSIVTKGADGLLSWALESVRANAGDAGKPCGYDFNETVLQHPFDGAEHVYRCPRCGVEGTFRSPRYELEGGA